MRILQPRSALVLLIIRSTMVNAHWKANQTFTTICEHLRSQMILENPALANRSQLVCGQTYSKSTDPADSMKFPLTTCMAEYPGWQISQVKVLSQWVGPLVGFLLPSLVFTLVIPRRHRFRLPEQYFGGALHSGIFMLAVAFVAIVFDVLGWIIFCFGLIGPLMVGAIDESLKDWFILRSVEKSLKSERPMTRSQASYAIAITLIGPFKPEDGDLAGRVLEKISGPDVSLHDSKKVLEHFYNHQVPFGLQVGMPVVFFTGAYAYAIFDGTSKLGDNDTAHAIAFGLWYGVIVLTATCCCAVLGMWNADVIEDLLGPPRHSSQNTEMKVITGIPVAGYRPLQQEGVSIAPEVIMETPEQENLITSFIKRKPLPATSMVKEVDLSNTPGRNSQQIEAEDLSDSQEASLLYQPVEEKPPRYKATWLWDRTHCLRDWTSYSMLSQLTGDIKNILPIDNIAKSDWYRFFACVIAIGILSTLCFHAMAISYYTPIQGVGCRALSILIYICSQIILITIWFYHSEDRKLLIRQNNWLRVPIYILALLAFIASIFSAIGGTIMQLLGVYNNCLCNAGVRFWMDWTHGLVETATDTEAHRIAGGKWIRLGITGVVFIAVVCMVSWGVYMRMKAKCVWLIKDLK